MSDKITLVQCCKGRCGYVLLESEYIWFSEAMSRFSKTAHCPKCQGLEFYTLNSKGQARKQSDIGPRDIDPTTINPSSRMGLKMRRRILAAKKRALDYLAIESTTTSANGDGRRSSNEK